MKDIDNTVAAARAVISVMHKYHPYTEEPDKLDPFETFQTISIVIAGILIPQSLSDRAFFILELIDMIRLQLEEADEGLEKERQKHGSQ